MFEYLLGIRAITLMELECVGLNQIDLSLAAIHSESRSDL